MSKQKEKISALVITYNEIGYIEKCLESIAFADEIIVVDSYSTDGTYEYLLSQSNVRVIQNPFDNFTAQKSFALNQAQNDWILFVDADEVVSSALQQEIKDTVALDPGHAAYWFYRTFMFGDQVLRFSGWQTDKNIRLFHKDRAKFSKQRLVHEKLEIQGTTACLKSKLLHYCYRDFVSYKRKMIMYGFLKAEEVLQGKRQPNINLLLLKPVWKFLYNYIFRLGFLDGFKGLQICYLDAYGYIAEYNYLRKAFAARQVKALQKRTAHIKGVKVEFLAEAN